MEILLFCADVGVLEDPALFQNIYRSVSQPRREKVDGIRPQTGKLLSLGAGALLEAALTELGVHNPCPVQDANGSLYLPGRSDLCVNLSHSGTKVLCAVSDLPVGCDVERIRSAKLALARRCFCPEEYEALLGCTDESARNRLFYRYWTMKESFVKALGLGLRVPLNAFGPLPANMDPCSVRQNLDDRTYTLRSYPAEGYQYALCTADHASDPIQLTERSLRDLVEIR